MEKEVGPEGGEYSRERGEEGEMDAGDRGPSARNGVNHADLEGYEKLQSGRRWQVILIQVLSFEELEIRPKMPNLDASSVLVFQTDTPFTVGHAKYP